MFLQNSVDSSSWQIEKGSYFKVIYAVLFPVLDTFSSAWEKTYQIGTVHSKKIWENVANRDSAFKKICTTRGNIQIFGQNQVRSEAKLYCPRKCLVRGPEIFQSRCVSRTNTWRLTQMDTFARAHSQTRTHEWMLSHTEILHARTPTWANEEGALTLSTLNVVHHCAQFWFGVGVAPFSCPSSYMHSMLMKMKYGTVSTFSCCPKGDAMLRLVQVGT